MTRNQPLRHLRDSNRVTLFLVLSSLNIQSRISHWKNQKLTPSMKVIFPFKTWC